MTEETDQLAGGWVLTGCAGVCAGLWALAARPWPLLPVGVPLVVHGVRGLQLARGLASGQNDPLQRKALAGVLVIDAVVLTLVATVTLLVRRW
jgi:hypothetical protein